MKIELYWIYILVGVFWCCGLALGSCEGVKKGRGEELCKPNKYYGWENDHNLICQKQDGNLEIKIIDK